MLQTRITAHQFLKALNLHWWSPNHAHVAAFKQEKVRFGKQLCFFPRLIHSIYSFLTVNGLVLGSEELEEKPIAETDCRLELGELTLQQPAAADTAIGDV